MQRMKTQRPSYSQPELGTPPIDFDTDSSPSHRFTFSLPAAFALLSAQKKLEGNDY